ncbi:UNVERIFIED_CONTAM: hypothetical protein FKN15_029391 [Acipenser sinensis]
MDATQLAEMLDLLRQTLTAVAQGSAGPAGPDPRLMRPTKMTAEDRPEAYLEVFEALATSAGADKEVETGVGATGSRADGARPSAPKVGASKRCPADSSSRAQRGGAAASGAQRVGAATSGAQKGGVAASGAQRGGAAASRAQRGDEEHTSTTAPTTTPTVQSGDAVCGPTPLAPGHPVGWPGPLFARPGAQESAEPATVRHLVPCFTPLKHQDVAALLPDIT